ncbi:STAS domain-containing protein [Streptomyces sp. NPDC004562]|uniref:STAS domain-containing protein n=1 Tax=Streptomyces sp. NPDC004562 TaxID=3364703 RepID=UPI0036B16B01
MNDEVEIIETPVGDVRVVRVTGEFDADEADAVTAALSAPRAGGAAATVADLGGVTFADSSLLHALLTARQGHGAAGLPFVLVAVSPLVRRLLDLTDTARVFTMAPDLASALDLIRAEISSRRG